MKRVDNSGPQLERHLAECDSSSPATRYEKIGLLTDLAWALSDTDLQRAYSLAETAYTLASSSDDGEPPYEAGMAYCLFYPRAGTRTDDGERRAVKPEVCADTAWSRAVTTGTLVAV